MTAVWKGDRLIDHSVSSSQEGGLQSEAGLPGQNSSCKVLLLSPPPSVCGCRPGREGQPRADAGHAGASRGQHEQGAARGSVNPHKRPGRVGSWPHFTEFLSYSADG